MGSAAFSCLTCTSRSQLEFGSLHNTAAAAAGLQHLIPLLAVEAEFPWQTLLHKVRHGLSAGLLQQGGAGIVIALSLGSGTGSCWYMVRQRSGEQTQEWFGMKSISFCELGGILTPVTEYQKMAFVSSAIYANWSF